MAAVSAVISYLFRFFMQYISAKKKETPPARHRYPAVTTAQLSCLKASLRLELGFCSAV